MPSENANDRATAARAHRVIEAFASGEPVDDSEVDEVLTLLSNCCDPPKDPDDPKPPPPPPEPD